MTYLYPLDIRLYLTDVLHPCLSEMAGDIRRIADFLEVSLYNEETKCDPLVFIANGTYRPLILEMLNSIYSAVHRIDLYDKRDAEYLVDLNNLYEAFNKINTVLGVLLFHVMDSVTKTNYWPRDTQNREFMQTVEDELRSSGNKEITLENIDKISEKVTNVMRELDDSIKEIRRFDNGLFDIGERLFKELGAEDKELMKSSIKQECVDYAQMNQDEMYDKLKGEAAAMVTTSSEYVNREHWGKLMDSKKAKLEEYVGDNPPECYWNRVKIEMVKCFLTVRRNNELIDMDKLLDMIADKKVISSKNLRFLYELVLIHNIMCREIFKEDVEPKYDAWIRGGEISFDAKANTKGEEDVLKIGARSKIETIEELKEFIREWFVDDLRNAYDWYALFRFLDVNGYLKDDNVQKFSEEMNRLFAEAKKRCDRTTLGDYKNLLGGSVEKWSSLSDEEIKKVKRTSKKGVNRICSIYNSLKEKHDAL